MNWAGVIASIAGAAVTSAGLVRLIDAIARRRVVHVEVAERVNAMALEWAAAVQEDAAAAQRDATSARTEADAARRSADELYLALRKARREVDAMATRLQALHAAIMSPSATLEAVRVLALAQTLPTDNGT